MLFFVIHLSVCDYTMFIPSSISVWFPADTRYNFRSGTLSTQRTNDCYTGLCYDVINLFIYLIYIYILMWNIVWLHYNMNNTCWMLSKDTICISEVTVYLIKCAHFFVLCLLSIGYHFMWIHVIHLPTIILWYIQCFNNGDNTVLLQNRDRWVNFTSYFDIDQNPCDMMPLIPWHVIW